MMSNMMWYIGVCVIAMAVVRFTEYWSIGVCLIAMVVLRFTKYWHTWSNPKCSGKLPPGSMGLPLIGETLHLFIPSRTFDLSTFVDKRLSRYGKLFRTSLVGESMVISSDPDFNKYIFQQEGKSVELWYMDSFSTIFGESINKAISNPHIHKYLRNLFLNNVGTETLKAKLLNRIEEMANKSLSSWSTQPSVELRDSIASMVLELVAKELYDYDCSKSSEDLSKMFAAFFQGLMTFPLYIPGTAFYRCMKNKKKAVDLMTNILHERLNLSPEHPRRGDFVDQLIDDLKTEEFMTEEFAIYIMFGFLLTTFISIAKSLTMAIRQTVHNPLVAKELLEEHNTIIRNKENVDSPLTWKEYKSMTFTSQVINESLRMASIVPGLLRKVIKDIHVDGYVIPKGWTLMLLVEALHMNPDKFESPTIFNPWRWNDPGSISSKDFIPFGGGMTTCIGADFSKSFMSVFLHVFLTKFSFKRIFNKEEAAPTGFLSMGEAFHVRIIEKSATKIAD